LAGIIKPKIKAGNAFLKDRIITKEGNGMLGKVAQGMYKNLGNNDVIESLLCKVCNDILKKPIECAGCLWTFC